MHLKQLKLSGFKSFVDPTVVSFPSQLVAVVGPNGCGKSNIIDAVRWVMGESSAKNLRGESMIDVIFNGSSHRKSVGQASVELIFDNSLGRLIGPFASYGEIALKRVVTRDGDSSYYLNGARARRRDITDIFLGTGAGARGYSIIGQGTISRLIEAKPEELRAFLEEAAGVSKYKERRRETLQRIAHTHEHLTRVADIRDELDKQLQRLERQAKAAERYTLLKEEEALCRAEILSLKWRDFNAQQQVKQHELQELALRYEQQQSALTHTKTQRTLLNEHLHEATQSADEIQSLFYQVGTEVARLEESIQQQQREKKRLEQDRQQMQEDWQKACDALTLNKEDLSQSQERTLSLQAQVELTRTALQSIEQQWQEEQAAQQSWALHFQTVQQNRNALKSELQVAQLKLQHVEQSRQQLMLRLEKIAQQQDPSAVNVLESAHAQLLAEQAELNEAHSTYDEQLKHANAQTIATRCALQEIERQLHQAHHDFNLINSEYAALVAVQKAARQGKKINREPKAPWSTTPRLMDLLQVDAAWQYAMERVLSDALCAYVIDDVTELLPLWSDFCSMGEGAVTLRKQEASLSSRPRMCDKIQGPSPITASSLEHIYAAEDFNEALSWLSDLADNESVITKEGLWLGRGWVQLAPATEQDEQGLLARAQKITELGMRLEAAQQQLSMTQNARDKKYNELQEAIEREALSQSLVHQSAEALRVMSSALQNKQQELLHTQQLHSSLAIESEELEQSLEEANAQQLDCSDTVQHLDIAFQEQDLSYVQLSDEKQMQTSKLNALRLQVEDAQSQFRKAALDCDRELIKSQQLNETILREQERLLVLEERLEHLALLCLNSLTPELDLQDKLAERLVHHGEIESRLTSIREQVSEIKMRLDELEKAVSRHDLDVKQVEELIAQTRMQEQALAVRATGFEESLSETGLSAPELLAHLPTAVTQSMREDDLLALCEKIKRLGAINLAAIDEFSSEQQRKLYLDEQYADLIEALSILQTAIEKMDKETRTRLEHTFDAVNTSFKALFPRLFGGGKAQLELTCDNLLEAGIVVMAQPPGKRNSTIHLLSGGEKAMTAVALVFAIFQLNPSPFCMLDEVDAPLDDVNVGRFCDLVREMSQFVQFLFITHNKVTMELADHLIGVTMREPGVSRLVAVDVNEALTME